MSAIAVSPIAIAVITRRRNTEGILSGTGEEDSQKSTVNTQADIINSPNNAASMLYSGHRAAISRGRVDQASVEAWVVSPLVPASWERSLAS
jgi:hypothetical protein